MNAYDRGARWRSPTPQQHKHTTNLLFHCADMHGIHGTIPNFAEGQTWEIVHQAAHAAGILTHNHEHEEGV